jgi:hypothetical protein
VLIRRYSQPLHVINLLIASAGSSVTMAAIT